MSILYISEFSRAMFDNLGEPVMAPDWDSLVAEQNVPITIASVQSAPLNSATKFVLCSNDAVCSYAYGANPTAVATAHRVPANADRFYGVTGGTNRIAVIANT